MYFKEFDFTLLQQIRSYNKTGQIRKGSYNNCFFGADTETSKKRNSNQNHICAFSIACRYNSNNIMCVYGNNPLELVECFNNIRANLKGHDVYIYIHNLPYDWVFCRKFLIDAFGEPVKQLNVKPHQPIYIEFANGLILKDSLILFACKLETIANDLNVEHKKAVGCWDYNKLRSQHENFTPEEILYIENDVLALVECLDKTAQVLHKTAGQMPYTNTGIVRNECKQLGKQHNAHKDYLRIAPTFSQIDKLEHCFHGGFTHGNRYFYNTVIYEETECKDFCSSYPFSMIAFNEYPMTKFASMHRNMSIDEILELSKRYAFIFKLILIDVDLINYQQTVMPVLQLSKCVKVVNPVLDNGRILKCDYCEIYLNDIDLSIMFPNMYKYSMAICTEVEFSVKGYLPRWFTDYVFHLFEEKSKLKGKDATLYGIAKSKLNSMYGCCVQHVLRDEVIELYGTGEYDTEFKFNEDNYNKSIKRQSAILSYQWGVYCTSLSMRNLFELSKCIDYENGGKWLYSDTDSIYGTKWNQLKVEQYNNRCKRLLKKNGYGAVKVGNKEYCLGIAESDKKCSQFKYLGAKRYCYRDKKDNELHITVAGVPKEGVKCLNNDINKFEKGFCFSGIITGKLQVEYNFIDSIYTDMEGNITGDSINLTPCDYILDSEDNTLFYQESIPMGYSYE